MYYAYIRTCTKILYKCTKFSTRSTLSPMRHDMYVFPGTTILDCSMFPTTAVLQYSSTKFRVLNLAYIVHNICTECTHTSQTHDHPATEVCTAVLNLVEYKLLGNPNQLSWVPEAAGFERLQLTCPCAQSGRTDAAGHAVIFVSALRAAGVPSHRRQSHSGAAQYILREGPCSQDASWVVCGSGVPPYDFLKKLCSIFNSRFCIRFS